MAASKQNGRFPSLLGFFFQFFRLFSQPCLPNQHRSLKRSVKWLQFGLSPRASGLPKLVFKPVSLLLKYHLIITLISVRLLPILTPSTNHFINLPFPPFILSPHQFSHADRQRRFPQATSGLRVALMCLAASPPRSWTRKKNCVRTDTRRGRAEGAGGAINHS